MEPQQQEDELLEEFRRRSGEETVEEEEQQQPEEEGLQYIWKEYTEEELKAAEALYHWARSLTPEQIQKIDSILLGQEEVQEEEQEEEFDDDDEISELRRRLAELEQKQYAEEAQKNFLSTQEIIAQTSASWAEEHGLTPEELETIENQLAESGLYKSLSATYGVEEGLRRGLDFFFAQSPFFLDKRAEEIRRKALEEREQIEQKVSKSTAVSGGSGSIPTPPPPPSFQGRKKRANIEAVSRFLSENL